MRVVAIEYDAVVLSIRNESRGDIVVLSPDMPAREIDEERCLLILSTKVTRGLLVYAFTPGLETVRAGEERQFRAELRPVLLAKACTPWTVEVEYAFIQPQDVEWFKKREYERFRRHVLQNQKLVRTSAAGTVAVPLVR